MAGLSFLHTRSSSQILMEGGQIRNAALSPSPAERSITQWTLYIEPRPNSMRSPLLSIHVIWKALLRTAARPSASAAVAVQVRLFSRKTVPTSFPWKYAERCADSGSSQMEIWKMRIKRTGTTVGISLRRRTRLGIGGYTLALVDVGLDSTFNLMSFKHISFQILPLSGWNEPPTKDADD